MRNPLWKLLFALFSLASVAPTYALSGKLDLGSTPKGFVLRDVRNGQWRGGYDKSLYSIMRNDKELLYLGYTQTWNAEHGNSAIGLSLGKHLKISDLGTPLNLDGLSAPPFLRYLDKVLSLDLAMAYMPVHSVDVNGPVIGGIGATLDLSDVFQLLSKGL